MEELISEYGFAVISAVAAAIGVALIFVLILNPDTEIATELTYELNAINVIP